MHRFSWFGQQALVEGISDQGVLERIVTRLTHAMDQIEGLHRREPVININLVDRHCQQLRIKAPSYYRSRLEKRAVILRQTVDPSDQEALHARRQGCRYRSRIKVQFAGASANYAPLGEEADDFLGEERITLSLLGHLPRERVGQSLDLKARLYEAANVGYRKRF